MLATQKTAPSTCTLAWVQVLSIKEATIRYLDITNENNDNKNQILTFKDSDPGYVVEVPSQMPYSGTMASTDDTSLEKFFERPIKIGSFSWSTSTTFYQNFNPWAQFFQNSRNINRICNYQLLRCKLHVKFLINGNSFHYGRLLASYLPLHNEDNLNKDRALISQDNVASSQRPHVYLNPTTSEGGSLVLPFLWHQNALSIPQEEYTQMGTISIRELNALKHANGGTDPVTVTVFAWATDVDLSVPTTAEPGALTPQSGGDEYEESPASGKMLAASKVVNQVGSIVPPLAPMTGPASAALAAGSAVAKALGYSRPRVMEDLHSVRPTFFSNLPNANATDNCTSFTLDKKQGLSLDTRNFGLTGDDELQVSALASRESYIASFTWGVDAPPEDLIFSARVTPQLSRSYTSGGVTEKHMTPCSMIAMLGKYWRGTVRMRFQVVSSGFHKGRLKVVWDPQGVRTNEYNVAYTQIVDISQTKDFSIDIGWGQTEPFLETGSVDNSHISSSQLANLPTTNGVVSVYVVNDLAVPNTTVNNDIAINIFASCPDLQIRAPNIKDATVDTYYGLYAPQSGGVDDEPDVAPVMEGEGQVGQYNPAEELEFFGDPLESLRLLLKRYVYLQSMGSINDNAVPASVRFFFPAKPMIPGYVPNAMYPVATKDNYNACEPSILSYVLSMFVCWRGSIRYKTLVEKDNMDVGFAEAVLKQFSPLFTPFSANETIQTSIFPGLNWALSQKFATWAGNEGKIMTPLKHNPVLEYELPYYGNQRFSFARNWTDDLCTGVALGVRAEVDEKVAIHNYMAIGEDFQVGMFINAPVLYIQTD